MLVSQLSSTLPSSAGGGGKGSPSSPGKKKVAKEIVLNVSTIVIQGCHLVRLSATAVYSKIFDM